MAAVVRISDELYSLTAQASSRLNRSLTQQLEMWACMGAALDAAGITMEQTLQLLHADSTLKDKVIRLASAKARPERSTRAISIKSVAGRLKKLDQEVSSGERAPESLLLLPRKRVKAARLTFAPETSESKGW